MKKILSLLALLPLAALAQTSTQNFVKTTRYKDAGGNSPAVQITYLDGLGRPIQKIDQGQSNTGKDIVAHIEYDASGRQSKEFLPYTTATASPNYKTDAASQVLAYYASPTSATTGNPTFEATAYPYSQKQFEASPLNRVLKQSAPGDAWAPGSGHEIRIDYQSNSEDDAVKQFYALSQITSGGYYDPGFNDEGTFAPGMLYKTVTKNENWTGGTQNTTEKFTDKLGRMLLQRTYGKSVIDGIPTYARHDTYYVYDQYGNLSFVLPPLATNPSVQLDELCYQYRYDSQNRLVEKKLPGKGWEFMVYDRLNRIVAAGPANSPFEDITENGWLISKYDALGRIAYTGWYNDANKYAPTADGRIALQAAYDGSDILWEERNSGSTVNGVSLNYSNLAHPKADYHVLSVSYYDDYDFPNPPASFAAVEGQAVYYDNSNRRPKGLPTGSWVRTLQSSSEYLGASSYVLYDSQGRAIQEKATNYLGGFYQTDTKLDFSGKVLKTVDRHSRATSTAAYTIIEEFTYSAQDRLLTHTHQLNDSPAQLLSSRSYDELGQLIGKEVGNTVGAIPLQSVDYSYTVRGWLREINNPSNLSVSSEPQDLFAYRINYTVPENTLDGQTGGLYNGNIAETLWRSASDNIIRSYGYGYDHLNRLNEAVYQKNGTRANSYNESVSYDLNGNIMALQRNGDLDVPIPTIEIDDLTYTYTGNQLAAVEDHTTHPAGFKDGADGETEYYYDTKGNLIRDDNKGITEIRYNHLNLPTAIYFASGDKIQYLYDALGTKLQKQVTQGGVISGTSYLNGFQYEGKTPKFFATAEGYVNFVPNRNTYRNNYIYNYTDHLGNIRLSYTKSPNGLAILEENHYYPFGEKHDKYNSDKYEHVSSETAEYVTGIPLVQTDRLDYRYKYNGKEWQDELGLNYYDYGARNYDPVIGRFINIDRLAEKHESLTPYQYAANTPTYFIDINGEYIYINDPDNGMKYRYENGVTQHKVDGEWRAIDAFTELSDFVLKTVAGLNALENSGKTGAGLVGNFYGEGRDVAFQLTKGKPAGHLNGIISLDPNSNESTFVKTATGIEMQKSPFFVTIGHEMAHAQDPVKKNFMDTWYNVGKTEITKREIYASHYENMIRAESGLPLRTHYSGILVGENYIPEPISRLIDKMGNSVYYGHPTSSGKQNQVPATINDGIKAEGGTILKMRFNYYLKN